MTRSYVIVELLAFLVGLGIGLLLCLGFRVRLEWEVQRFLPELPAYSGLYRSFSSRLLRAIAQQRHAHQQRQEEINHWQSILQSAPIGYLQVDDQNQLIWCNPTAYQLFGITPRPLDTPRLLLEVMRSYELDELIEETRTSQKPREKQWNFQPIAPTLEAQELRRSPKPKIPLRAYSFPLSEGRVGVFLENRQEVVTLTNQRDRAFSDVAHELKTPLTSIRLVAETLQSRLDPPLRNWIDRLLSEVIRLSDIVQVLLDLSQLERGSAHTLNYKAINLPELIRAAWMSLEPLARQKQLQLHYQGPERLLMQGDEHRLCRVLINLLDNSIKYSPLAGQIWVKLGLTSVETNPSDTHNSVHLEVIDSGMGFPEADLPYVFERFYRGEPSRARGLSGTSFSGTIQANPAVMPTHSSGLGLAIVRQIVEAHQGWVTASNHPDLGGAWIQISLPRSPSAELAKT